MSLIGDELSLLLSKKALVTESHQGGSIFGGHNHSYLTDASARCRSAAAMASRENHCDR